MNQNLSTQNYNWYLNGYGSTTTKNTVESVTSSCNNNYDKSIVFYTGHGWPSTPINGVNHYHIYSSTSGAWNDGIQDVSIQSRTTAGKHYFTLIWACFQGNTIGYYHQQSGAVEMPYAWTQRTNLNTNGYKNNDGTAYCWIGFENTSPPLHLSAGPYGYEYGNIVKYFYYFLAQGNTIHQALDNAAYWVFNTQNFAQCPLTTGVSYYDSTHQLTVTGWMKVYGNSYITLP